MIALHDIFLSHLFFLFVPHLRFPLFAEFSISRAPFEFDLTCRILHRSHKMSPSKKPASKLPPRRILTRPSPYRRPVQQTSPGAGGTSVQSPPQTSRLSPPRASSQPSKKAKGKARARSVDPDDDYEDDDDSSDVPFGYALPTVMEDWSTDSSEEAGRTLKEPSLRHSSYPKNPLQNASSPPSARKTGSAHTPSSKQTKKTATPSPSRASPARRSPTAGPSPPRAFTRGTTPSSAKLSKRCLGDGNDGAVLASSPKRVKFRETPTDFRPSASPGSGPGYAGAQYAHYQAKLHSKKTNEGQHTHPAGNKDATPAAERPLTIEDADGLFQEILGRPRALELGEISALFVRLQEMSFRLSQRHFDFKLTATQEAAWPLHLLSTQYKPLMLMAQYIADGSRYTWRSFFTKPEHRVPLIHGIIGEWFKHRIFNHTAFGVPDEQLKELEAIDREYIHYDAFVRCKKRAEVLERLKFGYGNDDDNDEDPYFPDEHGNNLDVAAFELAGHLVQLLEPLLPPPIFDPLRAKTDRTGMEKERADSLYHEIFMDLFDLIRLAASLHLSIRFTGIEGTIVRIAPHMAKGSVYDTSPNANNICVNAQFVNATKPLTVGPRDALQVKMTCWGRVEAVVPQGPDRLDLERQADVASAEDFDGVFPVLPYDLQESNAGRAAVEHDEPLPGTEWSIALANAAAEESRGHRYGKRQVDSDDEEEGDSSEDDETTKASKPLRGSFVTVYPNVAPSNLYCVWVDDAPSALMPVGAANSRPETLEEAVAEARRAKGIYYRIEDLGIQAVNTVLKYRAQEWAVATGVLGGLAGGMVIIAVEALLKSTAAERTEVLENIRSHLAQFKLAARHNFEASVPHHLDTLRGFLQHSGQHVKTVVMRAASSLPLSPSAALGVPLHGIRERFSAAGPTTTTLTRTVVDWTVVTVEPPLGAVGEGIERLSAAVTGRNL
ncbi:hypothetical protein ABEF93_004279 [Exophiala dermatitidis]